MIASISLGRKDSIVGPPKLVQPLGGGGVVVRTLSFDEPQDSVSLRETVPNFRRKNRKSNDSPPLETVKYPGGEGWEERREGSPSRGPRTFGQCEPNITAVSGGDFAIGVIIIANERFLRNCLPTVPPPSPFLSRPFVPLSSRLKWWRFYFDVESHPRGNNSRDEARDRG